MKPGVDISERLKEARESRRLNLSHLGAENVERALSEASGIHVLDLDLSSNGLDADVLPPLLGPAFSRLRTLRLKYNRLTDLPVAALPHLDQLEVLELDGNQIAVVDEAALAAVPASLRHLSLSSNGLARLPDGLGVSACRALTHLNLSNNPLTSLPDSLGSCARLSHLDVSSCRLTALPASLAGAQSLQRLFCQNNDLERVPPALGSLALKEWNLRANRLPPRHQQAAERGLAKFLAFLREEEEAERLQEIEDNRPVGIAAGPCMVYRCKAVLDDAVCAAEAGQPTDGFAWVRHGHAAAQHGSSVYVWGGVVAKEGRKTSELLVLDLDIMQWRVQPTRGERPCPRDGHALAVDCGGRHLLVFGGRKEAGGRRLADLHTLDLASFTWLARRPEAGPAPCPREQCSAVFAQGQLLIFGGRTNGARLNDLWAFDPCTGRWQLLTGSGTLPSPRQGAAACEAGGLLWVMGGQANFVLDDLFTFDLAKKEWQVVSIAGRSKAAARAGGHVIAVYQGAPYMYGGRDALGAQVSHLLRLRRVGPNRYEWVETEFCLQPNRSRIVLFDSAGRLCIIQSGHPLHKLSVDPQQIEDGGVIWDVMQLVPLAAVKDKEKRDEAMLASPKSERTRHACLIAGKLPPPFREHTAREGQALAAAAAFAQRWVEDPASQGRPPPCVVLPNECGTPKLVCTTLRANRLPHTGLHDLPAIAKFVAEFFTFEPLDRLDHPPASLVSPWSLLEWQAGDSFDLASLACSLLMGAGYRAAVPPWWWAMSASRQAEVALGDQSQLKCPWIQQHGLQVPPLADPAQPQGSCRCDERQDQAADAEEVEHALPTANSLTSEPEQTAGQPEAEAEVASAADSPAEAASDETALADSRPCTPAEAVDADAGASADVSLGAAAEDGDVAASSSQQGEGDQASPACPAGSSSQPLRHLHAFVLVRPGRREVPQPQLLDPATGSLHTMEDAPCLGVEWAWDAANFYCNLQRSSRSRSSGVEEGGGGGDARADLPPLAEPAVMEWNFGNPNCWLPLLAAAEEHQGTAPSLGSLHSKLSGDAARKSASSRLFPLASRVSGLSPCTQSSIAGDAAQHAPAAPAPGSAPSDSTQASAAQRTTLPHTPPAEQSAAGGGLGLQVLAAGPAGTPRLGGFAAGRELADFSLAYLSPDASAAQRCPSGQLALPGVSFSPLALAGSVGCPVAVPSAAQQAPASIAACAGRAGMVPMPPPVEMPPSWVPPLAVSPERLDSRCPRGEKAVQFRQARRELFARYGECQRWDGLVERLTTYSDADCSQPAASLELFERRRDCLERREVRPADRSSRASFGPGAAHDLRGLAVVRPSGAEAGELDLSFYSEDRADGLARRLCAGGQMEEWFGEGSRQDGLLYRCVRYASSGAQPPAAFNSAIRRLSDAAAVVAAAGPNARASLQHEHGGGREGAVWDTRDREMAEILERYGPAPEPGALLQRTFQLASSLVEIEVQGPPGEDGQLGPTITRTLDLSGNALQDDVCPLTQPGRCAWAPSRGGDEARRAEGTALRSSCVAAQAAARAAEEETRAILASRQRQEQGTQLVGTAFYDATRVKVEDSDGAGVGALEEEDGWDFLGPFLPATGARDMTAAEAEVAWRACLDAFDDRMADRRRVLATRVAESEAEAARLQGLLRDDAQHLGAADVARAQEEEAAAAFRLRVVRLRAEGFAAAAKQRRAELEGRLAGDKRLASALTPES